MELIIVVKKKEREVEVNGETCDEDDWNPEDADKCTGDVSVLGDDKLEGTMERVNK